MDSIVNLIESISNRSHIAIILVIAALILLVVTWAWMFSLQKKLEQTEWALNTLKDEERRKRMRGEQ